MPWCFLDVSAAFNCLRHSYLLQMLHSLRCEPTVIAWFRSYLVSRRQAVKVGEVESTWQEIDIGTPQGSILGPFMFIILINFILLEASRGYSCKTIAYADDTSLLFRIRKAEIQSDVQKALAEVEKIITSFEKYGLVINAGKTGVVLFRSAPTVVPPVPVQLRGLDLSLSSSVRCLGLTIHECLKWWDHMATLLPKCYAVIASIRRLRDLGVPSSGLLLLYKALLLPLLCYGFSIWGGGYKGLLRRAEIIQRDGLRAVFGRSRRDSLTDLFVEHNLLPLGELYIVHVAPLAFKMTKGFTPDDITFPITAVFKRTSRRATRFEMPLAVKESSRHALAYRLPAIWTSLPSEIRTLTSVKKFAKKVREFAQKRQSC